MDSATIIIGVIILLVCSIPFFMGIRKNKIEAKQYLDRITEFSNESNAKLSLHQAWNNAIIAIDEKTKQLFFLRTVNGEETKFKVVLNEVKKSVVIVHRSTFNSNVERVYLSFEFRTNLDSETKLEFFNNELDGLTITGQLQIAYKWEKLINELVTS